MSCPTCAYDACIRTPACVAPTRSPTDILRREIEKLDASLKNARSPKQAHSIRDERARFREQLRLLVLDEEKRHAS